MQNNYCEKVVEQTEQKTVSNTTITNKTTTVNQNYIPSDVEKAKKELWDKAIIFESLVKLFKQKDQKTQNNVKALLKTFAQSKDEYTRNIWIYFGYLVE